MNSQVINIRDVTYCYPGVQKPVLENINLEIQAGEFIGIVGANGSGRSTLCYCINGLIPHSIGGTLNGQVVVHDVNTSKSTTSEIAQRVGFVFSDPEAQLTQLTVADEVTFGPANLGICREEIAKRVKESLKLVQLEGLDNRNTHSLSGGQQQRLAIASVLAMAPDILILDEPTSNLDPEGTYEVFSIVTKLNRENNVTVIMVEHQVDLLAEFATRILAMDQGKIIADGTPEEIFGQVDLLSSINVQIPQITQLFHNLDNSNITHTENIPINVEQGVKVLEGLLTH
jgi:energy-coupling factor transport system ATP-binding protein